MLSSLVSRVMAKLLAGVVVIGTVATGAAGAGLHYEPPVPGPITDHFDPPPCPWCTGNRGIDYATAPGQPVRASERGVVTFAGQVGGDLFVVVTHPDGLRTTSAYLASISVKIGQTVAKGDVLGLAASSLHFGVRRGDRYLDPELLLAGALQRAVLVPVGRNNR
jgi:murein DD-endopeptidase MepM/ murein hydrolase activator NlpD